MLIVYSTSTFGVLNFVWVSCHMGVRNAFVCAFAITFRQVFSSSKFSQYESNQMRISSISKRDSQDRFRNKITRDFQYQNETFYSIFTTMN